MSKLLELKIRNYEKIIHDHNRANKHFYDELLVLVQQCEGRYKSVAKAPDDSPEWQSIVIKRTEQPVLSFRSRKMGDMSAHEAAEIRQEVVELYNRGYPTATIAHILGIRASTARSIHYQHQINSQNARKVKMWLLQLKIMNFTKLTA
jgi:DNA-directed RNA polymerase specialized sigma24 family protein